MNDTKIRWTESTWNPVTGCDKVSPGCAHCYAQSLAERLRGTPAFPHGFELHLREHKIDEPRRLRKPRLIFVNSMSDLFHENIPDEYRDRIIATMRSTPQHTYQVLTKRPKEAVRVFEQRTVPDNVWLGVSVENARFTWRIDVLHRIPARTRFLSLEPLLGPLPELDLRGIHWVIVGGESGRHLLDAATCARRGIARRVNGTWVPRPDRVSWVRSIRDQCVAAHVPFFFKQWGGLRPDSAGHLLDGREHDHWPAR